MERTDAEIMAMEEYHDDLEITQEIQEMLYDVSIKDKAKKITIKIKSPEDVERPILKSSEAAIRIKEIGFDH